MRTLLIADPSDATASKAVSTIERELPNLSPVVSDPGEDIANATLSAAGAGAVVIVAGERGLNAAVNALMTIPRADRPSLGIVPVGECGLAQTFGLSSDPVRAARQIAREESYVLDVGLATCAGVGSHEVSHHFVNIAEVGFGARMVSRALALPPFLGRGRRFLAFWTTLYGSRVRDLRVSAGRRDYRGPAFNVVIGNGQYTGAGLRLSPRSYPGDGILDISIMKGPRSDAFRMMPKMYLGEHIPSPSIVEMRGSELEIEAEREMLVHVDGLVIGTTPARFSIEPGALRLLI